MTVEVRTTIKFKPWRAPNYALLENVSDGKDGESHTIHVQDLDADALEALAQTWLDDLYDKAKDGITNPFRAAKVSP